MDVTDVIGRFGIWQRRIFYVLLYHAIPAAFVIYNVQFFKPDLDQWCCVRWEGNLTFGNDNGPYSFCNDYWNSCWKFLTDEGTGHIRYVKCDSWQFSTTWYGRNMKAEFNLVCGRAWLITLSLAMLPFGAFISYIPAGRLCDKYGRRRLCLIGMTALVVVGVAGVFSPNIEFFLVERLLTGIAYGIYQTAALCLFVEAVGPEYRMLLSFFFMGTWGLGMMALPGVALLLKDWRMLQLTTYVLALLSPALVWKFVPESPRWLLNVGRDEEAKKIICEAAKMNGIEIVDIENVMRDLKRKIEDEEVAEPASEQKRSTFSDFLRIQTIKRLTLILYFAFLVTVFIYYAYTTIVGHAYGDGLHVHMVFVGLADVIGSGVFLLVAKITSRRMSLLRCCFLSGFFFLAAGLPLGRWLQVSIASFGRMCNSMTYTLLWLVAAEIFPTSLRAEGVSRMMAVGRIGNMLAAFVDLSDSRLDWDIIIPVCGSLALLTSVLCFLLPNIKEQHLPDTAKESESLPEIIERRGVDRSELTSFLHKVFVSRN